MNSLHTVWSLFLARFGWLPLLMIGSVACLAHGSAVTALSVDKEKPKKQRPAKATKHETRGHITLRKLVSVPRYQSPHHRVPLRSRRLWGRFSNTSIRKTPPASTSQMIMAGPLFSFLLVVLLLLAVPGLFLIGGLTGGIGWLIAGAVAATLWLFFTYLIVLLKALYIYDFGLPVFIFLSAVFIAGFIWALIAALPVLLILSGIFGGLALIGIGIYGIHEIIWKLS